MLQFNEDFRKNAVKLSQISPKAIGEIAEDLGIHEKLMYNWRRKYTESFIATMKKELTHRKYYQT